MLRSAKKRQSIFPTWKISTKTISFFALLILLFYSGYKIKDIYQFPITEVKVFGANHIDHQAIQQIVMPLIAQGFFSTQVGMIKERLQQQPWAANVTVRRVWPDEVVVAIKERAAIARWNDAGLLSSAGDIFMPNASSYPSDLPRFVGAEGQQIFMLQFYEKINRLFTPLQFKIARLELMPDNFWEISLDNGMKLTVGHKDILTRINHFVKVYPKIIGDRSADVDYVDLRYANGFAVKWKQT